MSLVPVLLACVFNLVYLIITNAMKLDVSMTFISLIIAVDIICGREASDHTGSKVREWWIIIMCDVSKLEPLSGVSRRYQPYENKREPRNQNKPDFDRNRAQHFTSTIHHDADKYYCLLRSPSLMRVSLITYFQLLRRYNSHAFAYQGATARWLLEVDSRWEQANITIPWPGDRGLYFLGPEWGRMAQWAYGRHF